MAGVSPEWRRGAVWSGAQLGIYRDLDDPEGGAASRGRGRRDAWRLRCCLATAGVALAALLVSIALVDVAGSGSGRLAAVQTRDRKVAGRAQGATTAAPASGATPAEPHAGGGPTADTSPVATAATTTTPVADAPLDRSDTALLPTSSHHRSGNPLRRFRDGRSKEHHCSGNCDEGRQLPSQPEGSLQEDDSTGSRSKHRKGVHRQDVRFPESGVGGEAVQYAQLAGYKFSGGPNSIQDVIRYLSDGHTTGRPHRNQHRQHQRGRHRQHVRFPAEDGPRPSAVRFSGVYSMSRPGGERHQLVFPGNEPETDGSNARLTVTLPPPPLNGHAYVADPFVNFRPEDPSQINLLASSGLRFALPARSLDKVSQWQFPPPPPPPARQSSQSQTQSQLYTEVVYHPLGHAPAPTTHTQRPNGVRPISLMLDVYPLTADGQVQYRPPPPRPRPAGAGSHMVVHLNLYPRNGRHDPHDRSDEFDYAEGDPTQEDIDPAKENSAKDDTAEASVSSPAVFCNKTVDVILRMKDLQKPLERDSQGNKTDTKDDEGTRDVASDEDALPLDPREASGDISGDADDDDQVEGARRGEDGGVPTNGHQWRGGSGDGDGSEDYDVGLDGGPTNAEDYVSAVGYFGGLESRYQTPASEDLGEEGDRDTPEETQVAGPEDAGGTHY